MITDYQNSHNANTIPRCKYWPTCSEYSKQCYQNYSFIVASFLTFWRILRCNPFAKGGYDPIPKDKKKLKEMQKKNYLSETKILEEDN